MATLFQTKAPEIMEKLIPDFGFSELDAAAVVGNLGHESGGFKFLQELKPMIPGSKGGYGWAQWTGPRRREYEAYCKRNKLDPKSDKANYGFLWVELKGTEKRAVEAVKKADTLREKVIAFELNFERAGIKHYPARIKYAEQALEAYRKAKKIPTIRPEPEIPKPTPRPPLPDVEPVVVVPKDENKTGKYVGIGAVVIGIATAIGAVLTALGVF